MDFSNVLIHSSSVGKLMTEPKLKKDKDAGNLSATAKTHLREVFIEMRYGRKRDIETIAMKKGTNEEEEGITSLALFDGRMYKKNTQTFKNEYITGTPDIIYKAPIGIAVWDVKCSWSDDSFFKHLGEEMEDIYYWQVQSYYWLVEGVHGGVGRCLINTPEELIQIAISRMRYHIPQSSWEWAEIELRKKLVFDDIPLRERVIKHHTDRNQADIDLIPGKIIKAREYLQFLDKIQTDKLIDTELK